MPLLSDVKYWNDRYQRTAKQSSYDWFMGFSSLRHLLNPIHFSALHSGKSHEGALLAPSSTAHAMVPSRERCRVLVLGCGNSTLGEQMQQDGWTGPIVNVDFSSVVIDQMKAKYSDSFYQQLQAVQQQDPQRMTYLCADVTERLPLADHSFDLIVCKGTLDAILCGPSYKASTQRMMQETSRLLAPNHGVFFLVTSGTPDNRIEYLEYKNSLKHYWESVFCHSIPGTRVGGTRGNDYYVYICRRRGTSVAPRGLVLKASDGSKLEVVHEEEET